VLDQETQLSTLEDTDPLQAFKKVICST
jgi:hypothetical protein